MTDLQLRKKMIQPVEMLRLTQCISLLGVKPDRKNRILGRTGFLLCDRHNVSEGHLWDLFEKAKAGYRELCKKHQVHLKDNHEVAVWVTGLWRQTKKLFNRRGIEV